MLPFLVLLLIIVILLALAVRFHMLLYQRGALIRPVAPVEKSPSYVDIGIPDRTPPRLVAPFLAITAILILFLIGLIVFFGLLF